MKIKQVSIRDERVISGSDEEVLQRWIDDQADGDGNTEIRVGRDETGTYIIGLQFTSGQMGAISIAGAEVLLRACKAQADPDFASIIEALEVCINEAKSYGSGERAPKAVAN